MVSCRFEALLWSHFLSSHILHHIATSELQLLIIMQLSTSSRKAPFRPNLANFNSSVHLFSYFKIISGRYSHALFHVSHLFSFLSAPHKSCALLYPLSSFLAIPPFNLASQQHAARHLLVQNFIASALVYNFSRFYGHFSSQVPAPALQPSLEYSSSIAPFSL